MPLFRHTIALIFWLSLLTATALVASRALHRVDTFCYTKLGHLMGWKSTEQACLLYPGEEEPVETMLLTRRLRNYPTVTYVVWDTDFREGASPTALPKMQEMATILHCLSSKLGIRSVGISTTLSWDDAASQMSAHMLARALQAFSHAVIGLHGRKIASAAELPQTLRAIPSAQIEGDPSELPAAMIPLPASLPAEAPGILAWAPDYIEAEPLTFDGAETRGMSSPLLVRWGESIVPTLPLALAMKELGLSMADIHVQLGTTLKLGERTLPLDQQGRTPLGNARAAQLSLTDLLTAPHPATPPAQQGSAILSRPLSAEHVGVRGRQLALSLSALLAREHTALVPTRLPSRNKAFMVNFVQHSIPGRILIGAFLICALIWLPQLPWQKRTLILLGLGCGILALGYLWYSKGVWMSVSAWTLCWLILIGAQWALAPRKPKPEPPKLWD